MKIGVIGLGSIGMRHAKNLQALGHEIIGYDPIKERRDNFPGDALTEDAYVISSPTAYHANQIMECALRGLSNVFVEKPIASVHNGAFAPVSMVGYHLRFHPCVIKAKEWIDAGKIGKPLWANFVCAQYNDKPAYLRDGVILNWSHEIDLALHLLGPAHLEASSTRIVDGYDDMTDILLTHESGCRTSIHLDYISKIEKRYTSIHGEKASIYIDLPYRSCSIYTQNDTLDGFGSAGSYDTDYIDEMKAFINRIQGKETPGCTGAEALRVLEICLEVRRQAGMTS